MGRLQPAISFKLPTASLAVLGTFGMGIFVEGTVGLLGMVTPPVLRSVLFVTSPAMQPAPVPRGLVVRSCTLLASVSFKFGSLRMLRSQRNFSFVLLPLLPPLASPAPPPDPFPLADPLPTDTPDRLLAQDPYSVFPPRAPLPLPAACFSFSDRFFLRRMAIPNRWNGEGDENLLFPLLPPPPAPPLATPLLPLSESWSTDEALT